MIWNVIHNFFYKLTSEEKCVTLFIIGFPILIMFSLVFGG